MRSPQGPATVDDTRAKSCDIDILHQLFNYENAIHLDLHIFAQYIICLDLRETTMYVYVSICIYIVCVPIQVYMLCMKLDWRNHHQFIEMTNTRYPSVSDIPCFCLFCLFMFLFFGGSELRSVKLRRSARIFYRRWGLQAESSNLQRRQKYHVVNKDMDIDDIENHKPNGFFVH